MSASAALRSLVDTAAERPPLPSFGPSRGGRVAAYDGLLVEAVGIEAAVGTVCRIGADAIAAEVIGFRDGRALLMGLAALGQLMPGAAVLPVAGEARAQVGAALLGRVIDGSGKPLDGGPAIVTPEHAPLESPVANPLGKTGVRTVLDVGVRTINALLTLGRGQRVGIMAGSGVGKSMLLGQIARAVTADVVVVALIGERGREIAEFLDRQLDATARRRTVVVAVPADDAPLLRVRGAMRAHAIAEHFRAQGSQVLLILDSLTRVAHAQREIGLALGEAPGARGYPPSAIALLPRLVERGGNDAASGGSVTAIYTVLADGDDMNDPVVDAARGVLDGHIILSRAEAQRGIYPAIDVSSSISRVMRDLVTPAHAAAASAFARAHALIEANRDLVLMGAYAPGAEPELDHALAARPAMDAFRTQRFDGTCSFAASVAALAGLSLAGGAPSDSAIDATQPELAR